MNSQHYWTDEPEPRPSTGAQPVDQVAIRKLGGFNFLSVAQWAALPRDEQARLIKSDAVAFLYEGEPVPLRAALLYIRSLNQDVDPGFDPGGQTGPASQPDPGTSRPDPGSSRPAW